MARKISVFLGVLLFCMGALGYVNNPLVGDEALIQTNAFNDFFHIFFGIVLVLFSKHPKIYFTMRILSVVFLVLSLLGFLFGEGRLFSLFYMNLINSWIYFAVSAILFAGSVVQNSSLQNENGLVK
ncbi:MAG: hypothetical protein JNN11_02705 [Candidatus Doudnabacteria bacterium]|nr:hypothetical protein [Candidatus Doudnabacteria bacterium]